MGFEMGFGMFNIMFFLIFGVVIVMFIVTAVKGISTWNKNNNSPPPDGGGHGVVQAAEC